MIKRALLGYLVTAVACSCGYTYAILLEYQQRVGFSVASPGSVFAMVLFCATPLIFILGTPVLLCFERYGWRKFWMYGAAGTFLGGLTVNGLFGPSIPFSGPIVGAVGGLLFWAIFQPNRFNSSLHTDPQAGQ